MIYCSAVALSGAELLLCRVSSIILQPPPPHVRGGGETWMTIESMIVLSSSMALRSLLGRFRPTISAVFEAVLGVGRAAVGHFFRISHHFDHYLYNLSNLQRNL